MEIFIIPFIASILLSLSIAPLSVLTNWFKLSWFGETLAHASLLGVGLGVVFAINPFIAIILISLLLAWVTFELAFQEKDGDISLYLAIFSHGFLALGALLALTNPQAINIESLLFGQIINTGLQDIIILAIIACLAWFFLIYKKKSIILSALHSDLAAVEGVKVKQIHLMILLLLSISISFSIQFVGILLIASLLVIPSAVARIFAKNPTGFIVITTIVTLIAALGGDFAAISFNWPFGPTIVALAFVIWLLLWSINRYFLKLFKRF
ncbi:MAG: metal ABC transporter permease [Alphaproteobacteria bacterium]